MRNSDKPTRLTTTTDDHELVFSQELGLSSISIVSSTAFELLGWRQAGKTSLTFDMIRSLSGCSPVRCFQRRGRTRKDSDSWIYGIVASGSRAGRVRARMSTSGFLLSEDQARQRCWKSGCKDDEDGGGRIGERGFKGKL
jgi:hypothetical protein